MAEEKCPRCGFVGLIVAVGTGLHCNQCSLDFNVRKGVARTCTGSVGAPVAHGKVGAS